ncbi:hydroxymethylglutaryl-CoA lyase [Pollutimonas bauzanensis]|uniref:Hydroxymethylglutaryl-CoA lyase n=1 Tax=Pollutimonas bauzanensis TaxID=658167 RepID=A0A1M5Y9K0_9BURK|nr:hydroxymethylglutaryl-CoA lyase [Pollutimonas bauzanensis]SHI08193.1 hydroxymethylglutaryl-CoA lyase [Pollutimonas bauzanensis]
MNQVLAAESVAPAANGRIQVTEVGMRDGLQIESRLIPAEQKIDLLNDMIASGISHIEVTSFVSPKAVPQLADAEQVIGGIRRREDTYLMALVPNLRAAERAANTSVDGGVLLCSASETHNRKNLNRGIDESIAAFGEVAACLRAAGIEPLGGLAVVFGCPFEGDVPVRDVLRLAQSYADLGIHHVTLGDTTGMATPVNVRNVIRTLRGELPDIDITLHLHNTRGVGLANVLVGLEEGVRRFDASVGGLGGCPFAAGATGNICTEDLVYLLQESGYETGIDLDKAIAVAHKMERLLEKPLAGQVMRAGPRLALHAADAVRTAAG